MTKKDFFQPQAIQLPSKPDTRSLLEIAGQSPSVEHGIKVAALNSFIADARAIMAAGRPIIINGEIAPELHRKNSAIARIFAFPPELLLQIAEDIQAQRPVSAYEALK